MGLDIAVYSKTYEYGFRAGSYSGFGQWREELALMIGIVLHDMKGFTGSKDWDEETPFIELLNHSDCDGGLYSDECKELLKDFEKWMPEAKKKSEGMSKDDGEWFIKKYNDWLEAVSMVADDEYDQKELAFC